MRHLSRHDLSTRSGSSTRDLRWGHEIKKRQSTRPRVLILAIALCLSRVGEWPIRAHVPEQCAGGNALGKRGDLLAALFLYGDFETSELIQVARARLG